MLDTMYVVTSGPLDNDCCIKGAYHEKPTTQQPEDGELIWELDLRLLARNVSDAFAKDVCRHRLSFGLDEIQAALPYFIVALITIQNKRRIG